MFPKPTIAIVKFQDAVPKSVDGGQRMPFQQVYLKILTLQDPSQAFGKLHCGSFTKWGWASAGSRW
jgi:hypothetical protein